jgi:hypothetical protein
VANHSVLAARYSGIRSKGLTALLSLCRSGQCEGWANFSALRKLVSVLLSFLAFVLSGPAGNALGQIEPATANNGFVIRLMNGQTRFHLGETITLELGYGAQPNAPGNRYTAGGDRPGLAVYEFESNLGQV